MPKTWTKMKQEVECQMESDPQRATLSTRAWQSVEEGLRHLTGVGYNFEIIPKGFVTSQKESESAANVRNALSIGESQKILTPKPDPVNTSFDALVKSAPHA